LIENLLVNRFIEHHCKALGIAPHHCPHQTKPFSERKNRELEINGSALNDLPPGAYKNTAGANIFD